MRYHAFISYSHGADARLAPALQRALHRFAKPWWKARAVSVFRDETSLALAHSLPDVLTKALEASEHFILMASPLAAQSKWVAGECDWWTKYKPPERMLVVLSEGEIAWDEAAGDFDWAKTTALPPALKGVFKHEPLYLDLRWTKSAETFSDRDPRFLDAVARISAALRGMSLEAIAGEEVRQHRKTRRVAYAAVSAIALLAAGASAGAWIATDNAREAERQRAIAEERRGEAEREKAEAERQRDRAEKSLAHALSAADTLAIEMASGLKDFIGVSIERRRAMLQKAEAIYARLADVGDTPRMRANRARMLVSFVDVYWALGTFDEALQRAEAAKRIWQELAAREPDNTEWQNGLVKSLGQVGDILQLQSNWPEAQKSFDAALPIAAKLAETDPRNLEWQRDLSLIHQKIGETRALQGAPAAALEPYHAALAIRKRLAELDPNRARAQRDLAATHGRIGTAKLALKDHTGALESFRASYAIAKQLSEAEPRNIEWQRDLSVGHVTIGDLKLARGDAHGALVEYRSALAIKLRLVDAEPRNVIWQRDLAVTHRLVGDALLAQGNPRSALESFRAALAIATKITDAAPRDLSGQRELAAIHERIGDAQQANGDEAGAVKSYHDALAIREKLADRHDLAIVHNKIGAAHMQGGDAEEALRHLHAAVAIGEALVALDPGGTQAQHALFVSRMGIAMIEEAGEEWAAARESYMKAKAIIDRLVAGDAGNKEWRRYQGLVESRLRKLAERDAVPPGSRTKE